MSPLLPLGEQTTVLAALAYRLERDPDGPYLDFEGDAYTAREIDRLATRCAHAFAVQACAPQIAYSGSRGRER